MTITLLNRDRFNEAQGDFNAWSAWLLRLHNLCVLVSCLSPIQVPKQLVTRGMHLFSCSANALPTSCSNKRVPGGNIFRILVGVLGSRPYIRGGDTPLAVLISS